MTGIGRGPEDTPLQIAVRKIEVEVERMQRPVLALCTNGRDRSIVIAHYADLARMEIDAVSQRHGMQPMLHRRVR